MSKPSPSLIARRIEEVRLAKKMSRQELAEKLDVTRLQVWRIENGHVELGASDVPAWAKALGVPISSLFRGARAS
jgi:transcriptional regulator with XRE-family HTH domain